MKTTYSTKDYIYMYEFPYFTRQDMNALKRFNLAAVEYTEENGDYYDISVIGDLSNLRKYGKDYIGDYRLVKEYLHKIKL